MEQLVAGECGRPNPLVNLKNKVTAGSSYQNELVGVYQNNQKPEHYVPVQQSFDMQRLLGQVQNIQQQTHSSDDSLTWQQEFSRSTHEQMRLHKDVKLKVNSTSAQHQQQQLTPFQRLSTTPTRYANPSIIQPRVNGCFDPLLFRSLPNHMAKTGYEILNLMEDKVLDEKQVEEITKKMKIKEDDIVEKDRASEWVEEYKNKDVIDDQLQPQDLTEEDLTYWDKLQNDWNEMFSQEQFMNEEDLTLDDYKRKETYHFEEANPFLNISAAFEEGLIKLKQGDLISAILLFEEAVRVNPDHAEAWQYLGTSQAENEQENLAIAALKRCIDLQPDNLIARMALAVSYTNESLQVQACDSLKQWIDHNPRYSHLRSSTDVSTTHAVSSFMSPALFKEVEHLFLAAARISPQGDIDPDIQVALGVLFNLSGDYDKAMDCFQTGLQTRPESADIWNKLGATLANGGKSLEAVEAYRNALHIRPGFIRCRYNLGISCINMKAYHEATEHFLTALNMQRQGEDPTRAASTMSENIWSTLRMTLSMLGRLDLMKVVDKRDLKSLNNEFKISDLS